MSKIIQSVAASHDAGEKQGKSPILGWEKLSRSSRLVSPPLRKPLRIVEQSIDEISEALPFALPTFRIR